MPVKVIKRGNGKRPYKLVEPTGKVVGSSTTKQKAMAAARARNAATAKKTKRK